ncbi:MAG: sulfite exporter TauE/SafE family protein [Nitrospirae bacterium]|nr:MAG: sulfite exporter TauE/SafE family protein [Nitrospirota bacterium]
MTTTEIASLTLLGLTGSVHCLGMCGGFAIAVDQGGRGATRLAAHLLYHLGKTTSYLFLGAWAAWAGILLHEALPGRIAATALAAAASLLMAAIALQILGLWRLPAATGLARLFRDAAAPVLALAPAPRGLVLGMVNGFLPCPLVYAFVAHAARTARFTDGLLTMALLGATSLPSLVAAAIAGRPLAGRLGGRAYRALGLLLLLFALLTAWRGAAPWLAAGGGPGGPRMMKCVGGMKCGAGER